MRKVKAMSLEEIEWFVVIVGISPADEHTISGFSS